MTETKTNHWQDRCVAATRGNESQLGAILLAAFGRTPDAPPYFVGKASITSDGFIMCAFTARDGRHHHGAFVGGVDDLERNVRGLAAHLKLSALDRSLLFKALRSWLDTDYRASPGLRFERDAT
jgi:hypothetical protein